MPTRDRKGESYKAKKAEYSTIVSECSANSWDEVKPKTSGMRMAHVTRKDSAAEESKGTGPFRDPGW